MNQIFKNQNNAAVVLMIVCVAIILGWVIPNQSNIQKEISNKYNTIAVSYEKGNSESVTITENQIADLQGNSIWLKLTYWLLLSIVAVTLAGLLATWLQYIYTDLKFTRNKFAGNDGILEDSEIRSQMIVLAAALIGSCLIVASILITILLLT